MKTEYQVVKIIDENNIIINGGDNHGVKRNEEYEIFVEGEEVIDPNTKESLGSLDLIKARIKVKDVFENMSVCVNADTYTGSLAHIATRSFQGSPRSLNVDSTQISGISGGSYSEDKKIKIGDRVREALG